MIVFLIRCLAWMIMGYAVTRLILLYLAPRCRHCGKIKQLGKIVVNVHGRSCDLPATDCHRCTERYQNLWAEVCDHCQGPIVVGSLIAIPSKTRVHPFVHHSCIVSPYQRLGRLGENKVLPLWNVDSKT